MTPYKTDDALGLGLRVLDVALRPAGVCLASFRPNGSSAAQQASMADTFDAAHAKNVWGSDESRSGNGSAIRYTDTYRRELLSFLREYEIKSMFDAPCGDLNWMPLVLAAYPLQYIGGDVSAAVLNEARSRHPNFDLRHFDICEDTFPDAEVWHCRDCFFHLSFADIRKALGRFLASTAEYALLTTHKGRVLNNVDIPTGSFRWLDLERGPIGFPRPIKYLRDYRPGRDFPRYVGVWTREQIAASL